MHEKSITVEKDGRYYNLNSHNKKPLRPMFGFERDSYSNEKDAITAAIKRSGQFTKAYKNGIDAKMYGLRR